jgi:salicylate hydroxylase
MECKPLSVAIIGGGIGGITAALSLLRAGVGAGIQVSPNASCVLHRLGLAEALAGMGVQWQDR